MTRKQNFQTIAWFYDIYNRKLLNLDPPYQRRSVWNQSYKDFFIDTILLNYPAPAIFLYEEISPKGKTEYNVVDGKQRLTTLFEFINNTFPVGEEATLAKLRGKYFEELSDKAKIDIYNYTFLVEYLPTSDESIVNSIFDRINRNVAKLTSQELRHARFSGEFITLAEDLSPWIFKELSATFPRIASKSKKQMKDIELIAQILLLIEEGPKGYSSGELDKAFSDRDNEWEKKELVEERFRSVIAKIKSILKIDKENVIIKSRFQNQADFYSLFGSLNNDIENEALLNSDEYLPKLQDFIESVDDFDVRSINDDLSNYYEFARAASNRTTARKERINILTSFLHS